MKIRVAITGRNHAAFAERSLASVLSQDVGPHELVIDWTDDASDDSEAEMIALRMLPDMGHRINKAMVRQGGLRAFWAAIQRAEDDEIILPMGGDGDTMAPGSLARVLEAYADPNVWMTYGSFQNSDEKEGADEAYEKWVAGGEAKEAHLFGITHKFYPWDGTELRAELRDFLFMPITFRAWLGKKVNEKDLKIAGYFFTSSGDIALNLPIAEMAGPDHAHFIKERWYTRHCHPDNDTRVDAMHQYYCSFKAMGKPRYSRISGPKDVPTRTHHQLRYGLMCHPDGRGNITMPQGVAYGEELPIVGQRTQVLTLDDLPAWVAEVVKRSLACEKCAGKKECQCALEKADAIVEGLMCQSSLDVQDYVMARAKTET